MKLQTHTENHAVFCVNKGQLRPKDKISHPQTDALPEISLQIAICKELPFKFQY